MLNRAVLIPASEATVLATPLLRLLDLCVCSLLCSFLSLRSPYFADFPLPAVLAGGSSVFLSVLFPSFYPSPSFLSPRSSSIPFTPPCWRKFASHLLHPLRIEAPESVFHNGQQRRATRLYTCCLDSRQAVSHFVLLSVTSRSYPLGILARREAK